MVVGPHQREPFPYLLGYRDEENMTGDNAGCFRIGSSHEPASKFVELLKPFIRRVFKTFTLP